MPITADLWSGGENGVVLKNVQPLASGTSRLVYPHPTDPGLLIKVIKPQWVKQKFEAGRRWYKPAHRRYRELLSYLREIREHIALHVETPEHPDFVQKIVGFIETDLGLGLMVEAVRDRKGKLAPTLAELLASGPLSQKQLAAFDRFCESIIESPLIFTDFRKKNVVYGSTRGGAERFVLIDGLGFKTLICVQRMSKTLNRWTNRRSVERLRDEVAAAQQAASVSHAEYAHAA